MFYGLEHYLLKMPKSSGILITGSSITNNRLPFNVGRCTGVNREEWVCNKCNVNVIWDEFYVILECTNEDIVRLGRCMCPPITHSDQHSLDMLH